MTKYQCLKCEKDVDNSFLIRRVRCHYCGHKILKKFLMKKDQKS